MRGCLPKKPKSFQWCTFSLEWGFTWCKCPWRFILVKALAQVPPACVPFAFCIAAKCCSDTDAIIQRVVFFLTWVERFIQLNDGIMAWKLWTPKIGFMRKNSFSLHYIFWQWRILTIKKETLYEKSNIISFYTFVIGITFTKETWSLCCLVIFFGFHSHYLHPNVTWFPVVLVARKLICLRLKRSKWLLFCFITVCGIFIRSGSFSRNFLASCERKRFPVLMWPLI